ARGDLNEISEPAAGSRDPIRIPAACCGVVGLKASRDRFPVNRAWESVSTEGPLTRNVLDSALRLSLQLLGLPALQCCWMKSDRNVEA
ncbi:MAG: hypothetical protein E5V66_16610, partial [Mesorhizobium sp.]